MLILLNTTTLLASADNVNICTFGENETTDYFISKIASKSQYKKIDKTLAFENQSSFVSNCQSTEQCDIVLVTGQFMDQLMVNDMNEVTMSDLESLNCINKCSSLFGASNVFFLGESTIIDQKAKDFSAEELKQILDKLGYDEEVASKYIANNKSLYLKSLRKRFYSLFSESRYLYGIGGADKNSKELKLSIDKYFGDEIDLNRILISSALNISSNPAIVDMSLKNRKNGCLKLDTSSTFKENICNTHNKDITVANELYQQVLEKAIPNHEDYYSFVLDHYTKCVIKGNDCDAHKSFFQNTLNSSHLARDIYEEFDKLSSSPLLKKGFAEIINELCNTSLMTSNDDLRQWYRTIRKHITKLPIQNSLTKVIACTRLKDNEKAKIKSINSEISLSKTDYKNLLKNESGRKVLKCVNHSYLSQKDFKEAVVEAFNSDEYTEREKYEIMGLYYEYFPAITDQEAYIDFLVETPISADELIEKIASYHSSHNSNDLELSQNAEFMPLLVKDWKERKEEREDAANDRSYRSYRSNRSNIFKKNYKKTTKSSRYSFSSLSKKGREEELSDPISYNLSDIQAFLGENKIKRTDQQILDAFNEYKKLLEAPAVNKSFEPIGREIFKKILLEKSEISNSDVSKICKLSKIESKSNLNFYIGEYEINSKLFSTRNGVRAIKCLSPKHFKSEKLQVTLNNNFDKIENYEDIYYLGNLALGFDPSTSLKQKIIKQFNEILSSSRNIQLRTQIRNSLASHKIDIKEETIRKMLTVNMSQDELDYLCKRYKDDKIPSFLLPMKNDLLISSRGNELIQCLELEDDYGKIFSKDEIVKLYRSSNENNLFIDIFISKMKTVTKAKELAGYLVDLKKLSIDDQNYDFPQIDLAQVKPDGYENILLLLAAKNFDFISYTVPKEQIIDILLYDENFENLIIDEDDFVSVQPILDQYSEKEKKRVQDKYYQIQDQN